MVGGGGILQNVKAGMQRSRRWYFVLFGVFPQFPPMQYARGNIAKKRKRVEKLVSSLRGEENKQGAEAMGNPPSLPSVDKSIAVGFT